MGYHQQIAPECRPRVRISDSVLPDVDALRRNRMDFPDHRACSGAFAFGFFALMMVLQFVLVLAFLPETKGLSLEALQKRLSLRP